MKIKFATTDLTEVENRAFMLVGLEVLQLPVEGTSFFFEHITLYDAALEEQKTTDATVDVQEWDPELNELRVTVAFNPEGNIKFMVILLHQ